MCRMCFGQYQAISCAGVTGSVGITRHAHATQMAGLNSHVWVWSWASHETRKCTACEEISLSLSLPPSPNPNLPLLLMAPNVFNSCPSRSWFKCTSPDSELPGWCSHSARTHTSDHCLQSYTLRHGREETRCRSNARVVSQRLGNYHSCNSVQLKQLQLIRTEPKVLLVSSILCRWPDHTTEHTHVIWVWQTIFKHSYRFTG